MVLNKNLTEKESMLLCAIAYDIDQLKNVYKTFLEYSKYYKAITKTYHLLIQIDKDLNNICFKDGNKTDIKEVVDLIKVYYTQLDIIVPYLNDDDGLNIRFNIHMNTLRPRVKKVEKTILKE